ncbi:MAG: glycosyltransferase [Mediterranea sp.]|jgi:glycosyltransferase involved in cell wall biosynthesis|nr:glycosyltransferase [Mediterranea sp.]
MRSDEHLRPADSAAPLFSIVTVTYNAGEALERTIQSVLEQGCTATEQGRTPVGVEHIVVDGASTDIVTRDIIDRYRSRLAIVVSEPDQGLYDAMNKGIRLATGRYLCFLNAGDRFHSTDTLRQMADSLPTDGTLPDVLYGDTDIVDAEGRFLRPRHLSAPKALTWRSFRQGMLVCHQAFFARRELAAAEPYDLRYRYSADFDWCIRVMKRASLLHNTHLTLIDYLDGGMTTRHHVASLRERFRIMARHYGLSGTIVRHIGFLMRQYKKN